MENTAKSLLRLIRLERAVRPEDAAVADFWAEVIRRHEPEAAQIAEKQAAKLAPAPAEPAHAQAA